MKAIAAMDVDRITGFRRKLLWTSIPDNLELFKEMSVGNALVMGQSMFQSAKIFPDRFIYVLTNNADKISSTSQLIKCLNDDGLHHCYISGETLKKMIKNFPHRTNNFWLCGGIKIYQEFIPYCNELYMSHVLNQYEGDTYMPSFEDNFSNSEIVKETRDFWVVRYW
jgi:dihydrofolate reductase